MVIVRRDGFARYSRSVQKTQRWRALRALILARDGNRCAECGARHRLEIHHVRSVYSAPQLAYEPGNLMVLCGPCHTRVTSYEIRGQAESPDRTKWRAAVRDLLKNREKSSAR